MVLRIIREGEEIDTGNEKLSAADLGGGNGNGDGGGSDDDTVDVSESLERSYDLQRRLKVSLHRLGLQIRLSWTVVSVASLVLVANIAFMIYGFGFVLNPSRNLTISLEIMPGILIMLIYLDYAFAHILIEQLSLRYETTVTERNLAIAIENVEKEMAMQENEPE